jgi:ubiquinone/menaquinone biosynthesis C-methylase UbiE
MKVDRTVPGNLDRVSRMYSEETWRVYAFLDESLDPRGPDMLYDVAGEYLRPGSVILDAGCRDAQHLIRLVEAHDAVGVGVDPVAVHIERANAAIAAAGLASRIEVFAGFMQELPYPDEHFDFVWCRDVIEGWTSSKPAYARSCACSSRPAGCSSTPSSPPSSWNPGRKRC